MQIDDRDRRILALLQKDCRMANADLAAAVGMSASSLWRRVRAMEEAGVIDRYGAVVNPQAAGLEFQAILHVHLARHDPARIVEFNRAVQDRREVQECYATTGQADYHMRVLCRDLAAFNRFLDEFLFRQPAVASAQTNVVLRMVKQGGTLEG